jgi:hypothetical protein
MSLEGFENLYYASTVSESDYTNYKLSKIQGVCSKVKYSYFGEEGNLFDFDLCVDVDNVPNPTRFLYRDYYNNELERYRLTKVNNFNNPYLTSMEENLTQD